MYRVNPSQRPAHFNRSYTPMSITPINVSRHRERQRYSDQQTTIDDNVLAARRALAIHHKYSNLPNTPSTQDGSGTRWYSTISGVAAEILFILFLMGCTPDRFNYDYSNKLSGGEKWNNVVSQIPPVSERYLIKKSNKKIKDVNFGQQEGTNFRSYVACNDVYAIPIYKGGRPDSRVMGPHTDGRPIRFEYTITYQDGSTEKNVANITWAQRQHNLLEADERARSGFVKGVNATTEGKRFNPATGNYEENKDFVSLCNCQLTKQGLKDEAGMDLQQNLDNFMKSLFGGKALFGYYNTKGNVVVEPVTGVLERLEFASRNATGAVSNTLEAGIQNLAIDDSGAANIAELSDIIDSASGYVITSLPTGGGQIRTGARIVHVLFSKEPITQEALLKGKKNKYFWAVTETPLRAHSEAIGAAGIDTTIAVIWYNGANNGGNGGEATGGGEVFSGPAPAFPKPGP